MNEISRTLDRVGGKRYGAYKSLRGKSEEVKGVHIKVLKVQRDPYAPPSIVKVSFSISSIVNKLKLYFSIPIEDWFFRVLYRLTRRFSEKVGEGYSGLVIIPRPSNIIIRRGNIQLSENGYINLYLRVGLPSRRRRILAYEAKVLFNEKLPKIIDLAVRYAVEKIRCLDKHVYTWYVQEFLRSELKRHGLVSFIADGSILPRRCGSCEDPLSDAAPFESPPSLRVELKGPRGEMISGLGIRRGTTVIIGAAFQGKTTLLNAIASGIWNHVPGDGREKVVTVRDAVKIKTEEGRYVSCVNISPFIRLTNRDTDCFTTLNASGATSVAASFQEYVEAGSSLVLIDEDVVATNFLYLDRRLANIIRRQTVTPISSLTEDIKRHGISVVIASNGSLDLILNADTIMLVDEYKIYDISFFKNRIKELKEIATKPFYKPPHDRVVKKVDIIKVKLRGSQLEVSYDDSVEVLDLSLNEQLIESTQYKTLAEILLRYRHLFSKKSIREIVSLLERRLLDEILSKGPVKEVGEIRGLDLVFVISRLGGIVFSSRTVGKS